MLFLWPVFFFLNPGWSIFVSVKCIFNGNFKSKTWICLFTCFLVVTLQRCFDCESWVNHFVCFDKHLSRNRHARFLFHVGFLNSLQQCADSRCPYTREIRSDVSQKKHYLKRLSMITFNFRSCKLKIIVFRCCSISFLNKNQGKFVISTKKQAPITSFFSS